MEKSCETCNNEQFLSGDRRCIKPCDQCYSGWEAKAAPEPLKTCAACEKILTGCISKSGFCVYQDSFIRRHTVAEQKETPLSDTQKRIAEICNEIKNLLLEKNRKYGDSALNPKRVLIVNGGARSGKDSFVDVLSMQKWINLLGRMSTVDRVKQIALQMGCDIERKNDADRKLMSDIKLAWTAFNDGIFQDLVNNRINGAFEKTSSGLNIVTVMCREPGEIEKFVAFYGKRICQTVLIKRPGIEVPNNMADEGVDEYDYDYVINNDGSFEEFKTKIDLWASFLILESFIGEAHDVQ